MAATPSLRVRKSFRDVEKQHYTVQQQGGKGPTELETLVRAFDGICNNLQSTDPNSFFMIAGYHGEPFRGAGWSNSTWWGGYCYHGQILFPTWHRAYVNRLELALRSVEGCEDVALPFMDWCDDETRNSGLPDTFTLQTFTFLDGSTMKNPLYSYVFKSGVFDNLSSLPDTDYTKHAGYETVRYPLSGLVGLPETSQAELTKAWNERDEHAYPNNVSLLNKNIKEWLNYSVPIEREDHPRAVGTRDKFSACLDAPNYTLFSNTSSAKQYNQERLSDPGPLVVPLESPHNDMHLAVGGFSLPGSDATHTVNPLAPVAGSPNGDMGENETASFDPIFFFHHCFIDRMFWLWQVKHGQTQQLRMDDSKFHHYPGTNNVDSQGPTPGQAAGIWLDLKTPLDPFLKSDGTPITSLHVVDIESSLGYTYGPGSFSTAIHPATSALLSQSPSHQPVGNPSAVLAVSGISRGAIAGSFIVSTWGDINGKEQLLHFDSVLSRWHTQGCANCQTHLDVKSFVPLHGITDAKEFEAANIGVRVHTHDDPHGRKKHKNMRMRPVYR